MRTGNRFENITEAEKIAIVTCYESGASVNTITAQQQYGERLVYKVLHEAGVSLYKTDRYTKYKALDPRNNKVCTRCLLEKAKTEFSTQATGSRVRAECKECSVIRFRETVLNRLGLTIKDYAAMLETQKGVCACCGQLETYSSGSGERSIKALAVDHDHATGAVRALLCHRCNVVLGYVHDDLAILDKLQIYLKRHKVGG